MLLNLLLQAEFKRNMDKPDGQWYYFLHYSGWNKKYDEWVEAPGLVKAAELGMVTGTLVVSNLLMRVDLGVYTNRTPIVPQE